MSRAARRTRLGLAALTVLAVLAAALAAPPGSAAATGSVVAVRVPVRLCATPASGHRACQAIRLERRSVPVSSPAAQVAIAAVARTSDEAGAEHAAARVAAPKLGPGPAGGLSPKQLAAAYGLNVSAGAAARQTVAVVDAFNDPSARSDLNTFDRHYGIAAETARSFRVVNQNGAARPLPANDMTNWAGEITLDVQAVRAVCRRCTILLVETNNDSDASLAAGVNTAVRLHATEVANSYGGTERDPQDTASVARAYNHPGVVITAASGDDGWYDWDFLNDAGSTPSPGAPANAPEAPAAFNTVIGVGGTTLEVNASGARTNESPWDGDGEIDSTGLAAQADQGATGGGCSTKYSARTFQSAVANYASLGCAKGKRSVVDIAADADPYTGFDTYQTYNDGSAPVGWSTVGGTSLAAPLVAGMWALAGGSGGVSYPALSLYGHYRSAPATYDVTGGGNGFCGAAAPSVCAAAVGFNPNSPSVRLDCAFGTGVSAAVKADRAQCYAQPGYDGVAGVGTPRGVNTFKPMNPSVRITRPGLMKRGTVRRLTAHASDPFPGGRITRYAWDLGGGRRAGGARPRVKYATAGVRTIKVTVTDSYGRRASQSIKITVKR